MDKLTMATEVLLKLIETDKTGFDAEGIAAYAWEITDAMQAEADKRECKERPEVLTEEWQPDWSQAPAWANWWAMDLDLAQAHWYEVEPSIDAITWQRRTRTCKCAPSFGYIGNWKNSLRKRPQ